MRDKCFIVCLVTYLYEVKTCGSIQIFYAMVIAEFDVFFKFSFVCVLGPSRVRMSSREIDRKQKKIYEINYAWNNSMKNEWIEGGKSGNKFIVL